jgi:hypothetical protein
VGQVVEHLQGKLEACSSNPSTAKKKITKYKQEGWWSHSNGRTLAWDQFPGLKKKRFKNGKT